MDLCFSYSLIMQAPMGTSLNFHMHSIISETSTTERKNKEKTKIKFLSSVMYAFTSLASKIFL